MISRNPVFYLLGVSLLLPCPLLAQQTPAGATVAKPPAAVATEAASELDSGAVIVEAQAPLQLLDTVIEPGTLKALEWKAGETFSGEPLISPVTVIHGVQAGPTLCLTAAIHGDELNGVEIIRRVLADIDPLALTGTVIAVPIVNVLGFTRGSRYLPDRRDLNRYFPGNPKGSSASRIAYSFFSKVISHCDMLVDFHTGSLNRTNLPQLRADLSNEKVVEFVKHFGAIAVLHKTGSNRTLRSATVAAGIPAVTFELGEPSTVQSKQVTVGVATLKTLLDSFGMLSKFKFWFESQPVYYKSLWVRVNSGGILATSTKIGARVAKDEKLGTVVNPISNESYTVLSPVNGRVLGMALDQFVLPGYAAFHLGIVSEQSEEAIQADDSSLEEEDVDDLTVDPDTEVDSE